MGEMAVDGPFADTEHVGNRLIGQTICQQTEDFPLAGTQTRQPERLLLRFWLAGSVLLHWRSK